MIDCNVALGDWPFRKVFPRTAQQLVQVMNRCGIDQAWVSTLDGILHKDLESVNGRLYEEVESYAHLSPVPVLNPNLPGWEYDVAEMQTRQVSSIRLCPNYHQYSLSAESCHSLLDSLPEGVFIQVTVRMEDERRQHPLCQVPPTDLQALPELAATYSDLAFVVTNAHNPEIAEIMKKAGEPANLYFEVSHVEGVNGLASVMAITGPQRLLFGTHMPLFYPDSSLLKLQESDLSPDQLTAIKTHNATRILHSPRQC